MKTRNDWPIIAQWSIWFPLAPYFFAKHPALVRQPFAMPVAMSPDLAFQWATRLRHFSGPFSALAGVCGRLAHAVVPQKAPASSLMPHMALRRLHPGWQCR